jgi:hypothetical protein
MRFASLASLLLIPCAFLQWYHAPVSIESIDRLAYCACGYSTVSFLDGRITMVRFHHDAVKPGQQIGSYRVLDNQVELDITFNGKTQQETLAIDNIGIRAAQPVFLPYRALKGNSPKDIHSFRN